MNWDDLRIARAVYETGSFAAAAARLDINETTVARRLARLQSDLGVPLFDAADGRRQPTAACERLVALTATMSAQAERIAKIGEETKGLVGHRRIATTDSLAVEVLAPKAAPFLTKHPGLSIEFMASTENVNFSRWEADLAVRFRKPDKGDFVISKLADVSLYLFQPAADQSAGEQLVLSYPEDLSGTPESQYLAGVGLNRQLRCTTKNLLVFKKLVESRQCSAILPSFMCQELLEDRAFRISRLPERREIWLLVQTHLKHDTTTRAVIEWLKECFSRVS